VPGESIVKSIWFAVSAWVVIYLADYYLTIYSARLLHGRARKYILIEGSYELTPVFQKDVDALRLLSPAFLIRLAASVPLLVLIWWMSSELLGIPAFYHFLIGALILREAAVLLRHMRNLALAFLIPTEGSISGSVTYSRWLSLRLSAAELWSFAIFFLLIGLFLPGWFFIGGAFSCAVTGFQHWRYSNKTRPVVPIPA
jgi:hypothetical protein